MKNLSAGFYVSHLKKVSRVVPESGMLKAIESHIKRWSPHLRKILLLDIIVQVQA